MSIFNFLLSISSGLIPSMKVWLDSFKIVTAYPEETEFFLVLCWNIRYSKKSKKWFHKEGSPRDPNIFVPNSSIKFFDQGLQPLQNMTRMELVTFGSCINNLVVRKFQKLYQNCLFSNSPPSSSCCFAILTGLTSSETLSNET